MSNIRSHGMKVVYEKVVESPEYGRFAVLNNLHGGFCLEKFNKNGELSKRQPRDTWDRCFDTEQEAIDFLDQYFVDIYE